MPRFRNLVDRLHRRRVEGLLVLAVLWIPFSACVRETATSAQSQAAAPAEPAETARLRQRSTSCAECHAPQTEAWRDSDHALANREPTGNDTAALISFPGGALPAVEGRSMLVLGNKPLWQPLVPTAGGRWQAHELAFDPAKREWFNVFGDQNRRAGEWGHWSGRGMNWNRMCAHCHMTGFEAGYDVGTDAFRSTWIEHGVGCVQCHGETPAAHGTLTAASGAPASEVALRNAHDPFKGDRTRWMHTCATCHARQEALTDSFKPGDDYHEHYRVALPTQPGVFFPDGQQLDENFNWTSVLLSRMGHAGVTCMDCHDPHSNRTVLPVENNTLCMQCHSAPGRTMASGALAVPIDPVAHSRHKPDSTGNQCVSCHMPTRDYMQRAPRHDHGWLKPDPLLTKELGIPNACSTCHEKEGLDWVIAKADAWYGERLDSRQRSRARAVAAAQRGDPSAAAALLALLEKEDIPAWRATYVELLAPGTQETAVAKALIASLDAPSPLERAAAVRALTSHPDALSRLRLKLSDPSRLVRLDAAWALSAELQPGSPVRQELDAYLALSPDQPAGLARQAMDLANRGQLDPAVARIERALPWDATSAELPNLLGRLRTAQNRPADAATQYARAAELAPLNADLPYAAALSYAEAGNTAAAERQFRLAVQREPGFHRAWYNLGLLLASKGDLPAALEALATASRAGPNVPDYPYASATLHLRRGDNRAAAQAAREALRIEPGHPPSLELLRTLPQPNIPMAR